MGNNTTMGITVVPTIINGQPAARVTVAGTMADSTTLVDANGAEIALAYADNQFHVADYRGADALEG